MTPTPSGGRSTSAARAGNTDASVLPPAVGASTMAFLPSRMASPASSWTGRRLVQPRRDAIASCRRAGKRAKALTGSELQGGDRVALVLVGLRIVGRLALQLAALVGGGFPGHEAQFGVWVELVVLGRQIEDIHQASQELARHHPHVALEPLRHL